MTDLETIKDRVRKLMAYAGDGVAMEGEIDTALRLAAKLMDAHHLSDSDVAPTDPQDDLTMGEFPAISCGRNFSTWESVLYHAVCKLMGCVQAYITRDVQPIRQNGMCLMDGGKVRQGRRIMFYGPAREASEAADLFQEWARSIATMGVARWGGCFKGDGAMYCYGFASALLEKMRQVDATRQLQQAKPLKSLEQSNLPGQPVTSITLTRRYDLLKDAGREWLEKEKGVHLSSSSGGGGYSSGSRSALSEGRSHGAAANFSRRQSRRLLS